MKTWIKFTKYSCVFCGKRMIIVEKLKKIIIQKNMWTNEGLLSLSSSISNKSLIAQFSILFSENLSKSSKLMKLGKILI